MNSVEGQRKEIYYITWVSVGRHKVVILTHLQGIDMRFKQRENWGKRSRGMHN
jgi:hypothetical protein